MRDRSRYIIWVCNQPPRPTEPPTLSGIRQLNFLNSSVSAFKQPVSVRGNYGRELRPLHRPSSQSQWKCSWSLKHTTIIGK